MLHIACVCACFTFGNNTPKNKCYNTEQNSLILPLTIVICNIVTIIFILRNKTNQARNGVTCLKKLADNKLGNKLATGTPIMLDRIMLDKVMIIIIS